MQICLGLSPEGPIQTIALMALQMSFKQGSVPKEPIQLDQKTDKLL